MPVLRLHPGLSGNSRVPSLARNDETVSMAEWFALVVIGMLTAAASTLIDLHIRVPGHSILKVVFPVAAGLAVVPRRGAGTVISMAALGTAVPMRMAHLGGGGLGMGALTSLALIGPLLDLTLRRAQSSQAVSRGFVLAGLAANLIAFFARGAMKGAGVGHAGRLLVLWWPEAVVTYSLCGILAGLVSAFVWFCTRPPTDNRERESAS